MSEEDQGGSRRSFAHHESCSFCEKSSDEVRHLIPSRAASICDECVALCVEVIEERDGVPLRRVRHAYRFRSRTTER